MSDPRPPAHLLHVFATFTAAGPQVRTVALMEDLGGGWRHTVCALDGRTDARELLREPQALRLLPAPPPAGALRTALAFQRLLRAERPDLLLTYNWGAIEAALAALLSGVPHVHHEDGFRPDEAERTLARRDLFRRVALARARAVVVPSERLEELARRRWGVGARRLRRIPNGIALERFGAPDGGLEVRRSLGIPAGALVVGLVGHLRPEKAPARLVRAAARLNPGAGLHLLLLGDGPERERVLAAAAETGQSELVHLAGFQRDPRPYYRAMDVFALTSDTEQMPVALVEAMASHLPAVATDVGDVARMLPPEQAALVVPLEEAEEGLARALGRLLADPELRARLGRANRRRAEERYSFEGMRGAYEALYHSALGARR